MSVNSALDTVSGTSEYGRQDASQHLHSFQKYGSETHKLRNK